MPKERYSDSPGQDGDNLAPGIIGQVSGPRSWSEYETRERADGSDDLFDRRNVTPISSECDPDGRFTSPGGF